MLNDSPYCSRVPPWLADRVRDVGVPEVLKMLEYESGFTGQFSSQFSSQFNLGNGDTNSRAAYKLYINILSGL